MLHEFLASNRADLIERCRRKVTQRPAPRVTRAELTHGIPLFLDQLIKTGPTNTNVNDVYFLFAI